LSELQSDFVSKVSHELRTPLTGIRLLVETMDRPDVDEAVRAQCIGALGTETDRLTRLIERLLDWGRMEAGRKQFELKSESVKDVIDDAVSAFPPLRNDADISFACEVEPDLPPVMIDRQAIADALVNLLSNARKYGGAPPMISLAARRVQNGRAISLEVKDNGEGIPRPEHGRIFEKFYRIDDRLSRAREGSGLGLAIVKHIVRAHRGRILLDSEKGMGSTFRIVLPALATSEAREEAKERAVVIKPSRI
jgi:two-component system phosphate regulon sensor histidine kinase PhoR